MQHSICQLNHFWVCRSVQPSPPSIPRSFHFPQLEMLSPLNTNSPSSCPRPWPPPFNFLFLWVWFPQGTSISGFILLRLAYFTECNVLKVHPSCSRCQNVLPLKAEWYVIVWMDHIAFICQLSLKTCVASAFDLLWIMLLRRQVYKQLYKSLLSILLGAYPEVELGDHIVALFFIFLWVLWTVSHSVWLFSIPTSNSQGLWFLHILPSTGYFWGGWFFFF